MDEDDSTFEHNPHLTPSGPISSSRMYNDSDAVVENDELSAVNASRLINEEPPPTPLLSKARVPPTGLKINFKPPNLKDSNHSLNSDQALLSAIYNTAAIGLLVVCVGLCALLYVVLQAFVRPILWALLTSACLFSIKRFLTDVARRRLVEIERNRSMLAFEMAVLPLKMADACVDWIWALIKRRYRNFLVLSLAVVVLNLGTLFSYEPIANALVQASLTAISTINKVSIFLSYYADNLWMLTSTLVICYLIAISIYWNENNTFFFQIMSLPVWSSIFFLTSRLMGSYRPLFLLTFGLLVLIGIYSFVFEYISSHRRSIIKSQEDSAIETTNREEIENLFSEESNRINKTLENTRSRSNNSSFLKTTILNLYRTSIYYFNNSSTHELTNNPIDQTTSQRRLRKKENSDKYFIILFWFFVWVKIRYDLFVLIPVFVVMWRMIRRALLLIFSIIGASENYSTFKFWFTRRRKILAPQPFLVVCNLFQKGDHKCTQLISKSMDNIVTTFIMVSLVLVAICSVIILCIQVQSESTQLISFGSNILNEQLYSNPEWRRWLPERERLSKFYQTMIKKFHSHGREWLSHSLKSIDTSNTSDHVVLEAQILDQWDNLYDYLSRQVTSSYRLSNFSNLPPMSVPPKIPMTSVLQNETHRSVGTQTSTTTPNPFWFWANYKQLAVLIKDNIGVVMSIVDSLYQIFKGNLNLITAILWTAVSTIFNSGFALANFFVSFLVYMTFVFYLLSSSQYKPFQWIGEIKILEQHQFASGLSEAIEDSIRSVFVASVKMAFFFGIYTYTVNSLFSLSIIYLPSIMAGLVAFLPLVGTYWVAIPGILELWLVQERPLGAVLFLMMHLMPTLIAVDNAIYSEIKAGHPYLTGLAFAGGVYCLGLEGALIGPIVLCLLMVIVRVITNANISEHFKGYQLIRTPSVEK